MLEVESIHTFYGMSHILFDVSLKIKQGQVVCLLGRNGAGKTTTLRSIMGLVPPVRGRVRLNGEDVTGVAPYRLVRKGIGYVPDDRRIFADLTVGENLAIAARQGPGTEAWDKDKVYDLFPPLKPRDARRGGLLSGGEQKMLAIARALMTNPQLLLLDEPTEGLAPLMVKILGDRIARLKALGLTVLLAEQNLKFTLGLSDYGYIIDNGRIRCEGTVAELMVNEDVKRFCGL
jgi:branched-chain amino acid transport system ATP-binding protein